MTRTEVERAFAAHKDAVYGFAWRIVPAAADDIVQDVFLRLLRGQIRFDPARGSLRAFLIGVARNLALQRLRADARWDALDEERFVAGPLPFDDLDIGELVGRAVRALPPLQREVFVLAEYEELSLGHAPVPPTPPLASSFGTAYDETAPNQVHRLLLNRAQRVLRLYRPDRTFDGAGTVPTHVPAADASPRHSSSVSAATSHHGRHFLHRAFWDHRRSAAAMFSNSACCRTRRGGSR